MKTVHKIRFLTSVQSLSPHRPVKSFLYQPCAANQTKPVDCCYKEQKSRDSLAHRGLNNFPLPLQLGAQSIDYSVQQ